jgi:hypothetical protein
MKFCEIFNMHVQAFVFLLLLEKGKECLHMSTFQFTLADLERNNKSVDVLNPTLSVLQLPLNSYILDLHLSFNYILVKQFCFCLYYLFLH